MRTYTSLVWLSDEVKQTQEMVAEIYGANGGKPICAADFAAKHNLSADQAYSLLRAARNAGAIRLAKNHTQNNLKLYLPALEFQVFPAPEKLFHQFVKPGQCVEFIHPLTGETCRYSNK